MPYFTICQKIRTHSLNAGREGESLSLPSQLHQETVSKGKSNLLPKINILKAGSLWSFSWSWNSKVPTYYKHLWQPSDQWQLQTVWRELRANVQKNVAEQAERGMLRISHDFKHNTWRARGTRALLPYIVMLDYLAAKPCASTMQLQSHCCAKRSAHTCSDECLHMCLGLNAVLRLVLSRAWCGELRTLHSDV